MTSDVAGAGGGRRRMPLLAAMVAVLVAAPALLVVSALADLRSPEGTARAGEGLADDPQVRALLVDRVVDTLVADGPTLGPLLPLIRPLVASATEIALAGPAGRSAVASGLTDALRQLTLGGPVVIDLRAAVLAAAQDAPPPLDDLARSAAARGPAPLVLGEADAAVVAERLADVRAGLDGAVAGMPADLAVAIAATALVLLLLPLTTTLARPTHGPRPPRGGALVGALLATLGACVLGLLRTAPELLRRAVARIGVEDAALEAALLPFGEAVVGLLTRTRTIAALLLAVGIMVLALARGAAVRTRRATTSPGAIGPDR